MSKVWNKIETQTLVYGSNWDDGCTTIRAKIFGKIVEMANGRILYYQSDLYHDALWINDNVTGPMSFDLIIRESGTWIGDVVKDIKDDDWANSARFRLELLAEGDYKNKWVLNVYQSVELDSVNNAVQEDWREENPNNLGYDYYGNLVAVETGEDYTLPKEYHPYFSDEDIADTDVNPINASIDMLFEAPGSFPTPRNETTNEPKAQRKVKTMDDVRDMLEEKLSELTSLRDEINDAKGELENAEEINDRNIETVEEAINALDFSLDDVYVSVDISFSS